MVEGLVLFWIVGTILNGVIARERRRDPWSIVVLSIFLSPLLAYAYMVATPMGPPKP